MRIEFPVIDQRSVVGIGEMKISSKSGECLVTFALGSCLGITVHDPEAGVGGLVHAMLPECSFDEQRSVKQPAKFVDSGFDMLIQKCIRRGAVKERLIVKVAGGAAAVYQMGDVFKIGARNFEVFKRSLKRNRLKLTAYDVGGSKPRTMALEISTGRVFVVTSGRQQEL